MGIILALNDNRKFYKKYVAVLCRYSLIISKNKLIIINSTQKLLVHTAHVLISGSSYRHASLKVGRFTIACVERISFQAVGKQDIR